jgi:dTDP-4-amino-4,6-dideoxygalactose transaminase
LRTAYLPKLSTWTQRRCDIARRYQAGIANTHVTLVPAPAESRSVFHLFPVRIAASARDAFMTHLRAAGVQAGVHYPKLICDQQALAASAPEAAHAEVPQARALAAEEVSLPIHPYLADDEIDYTIEAINGWQP